MGLKGMFVLAADGPETMEAPADSSTEIARHRWQELVIIVFYKIIPF